MGTKQIANTQREFLQTGFLAPVGLVVDDLVTQINAALRGIGNWTSVTYLSTNFGGAGSMTWTVTNASVTTFEYASFGAQGFSGGGSMDIHLHLVNTTVGGTLNNALKVTVPASRTILSTCSGSYSFRDNATFGTGVWEAIVGTSVINFYRQDKSNWAASTGATDIRATLTIGVT